MAGPGTAGPPCPAEKMSTDTLASKLAQWYILIQKMPTECSSHAWRRENKSRSRQFFCYGCREYLAPWLQRRRIFLCNLKKTVDNIFNDKKYELSRPLHHLVCFTATAHIRTTTTRHFWLKGILILTSFVHFCGDMSYYNERSNLIKECNLNRHCNHRRMQEKSCSVLYR